MPRFRIKIPRRYLARDIETPRLHLRTIGRLRTLLLIAPWHKDTELMAGLKRRNAPSTLGRWLRWFSLPDNFTRFSWAIVPKGQRRAVGIVSVHLNGGGAAESHIAISDRAWRGRQISIEARAPLLDLFFDKGRVTRFEAAPFTRNLGSVFVYKKLGFRVVGTKRADRPDAATGEELDQIMFLLAREDWQARRTHGDAEVMA